jgi:trigger factor
VQLADLTAETVVRPVAEVGEKDIDAMIEKLRKQRTEWTDVERAAQDGDTVHMNFKGTVDGEVFEGGTAEDVPLILGSGAMIEGFEAGLVGASAGDEITLDVTFPEDYRAKHLAGKAATFEVEVLRVSEPSLPEVDETFAKAFGIEDGTVEGLRADVAKNMAHELKQKIQGIAKERVMDLLIEKNPVKIPQAMVAQESERMKQQMLQEMQQRGQSAAGNLPASMFEPQATRRVHLGLLVAEIIKSQGLTVDQERVRETIAEAAESYEDPQEVIDFYMQDQSARAGVENTVLENQVVDWVLGQVQVQDDDTTFEALMENKE